MCECTSLIPVTCSSRSSIKISFLCEVGNRARKPGLVRCSLKPRIYVNDLVGEIHSKIPLRPSIFCNSNRFGAKNGDIQLTRSRLNERYEDEGDGLNYIKENRNSDVFGSKAYDVLDEIRFSEKEEKSFEFGGGGEKEANPSGDKFYSPSFDFVELKRDFGNGEGNVTRSETMEDDNLPGTEGSKPEGLGELVGRKELRSRRQLLKRSSILAKQVISVQSALSLGFVSQLWVDTRSWLVLVVEVRPSLLSGEIERFLLEDACQVGDVMLIPDESVMENELKLIGLDTLVGYTVITPGRRNVGKVRGYTFNINSGLVESLELDSFGISIIPSSLVSTYSLFVEDVLEVMSDRVVVHEAAASRVQRLTKGFWDTRHVEIPDNEAGEYPDFERQPVRSRRSRKNFSRKFPQKMRETEDDWELPMDY